MIRSIASRKAIASIFTAAWSIFGAQSGYGQPPIEGGKIYWTTPAYPIINWANLDGSNSEQVVVKDSTVSPLNIALDVVGGKMYWTDDIGSWWQGHGRIRRADLDGSNIEDLVEDVGAEDIALDVGRGKMYWTSITDWERETKIRRADLDGSNVEDLVIMEGGHSHIESIALDVASGKMYWSGLSEDGSGKIQRADLDGSNAETLVPNHGGHSLSLDLAEGKMYWVWYENDYHEDHTIYRANLDGSNVEDLLSLSSTTAGKVGALLTLIGTLALDTTERKMYWTEYFWLLGDVPLITSYRANLDGSNKEPMDFQLLGDKAFDPAGGKMYGIGDNKIRRADLDGSNIEDLVSISFAPWGIAIDGVGKKMYWTDRDRLRIERADLDGSSAEVLVAGLRDPKGIAIDRVGKKIYWIDGKRIQRADLDGSNVEVLVEGLEISVKGLYEPDGIAIDGIRGKIYWIDGKRIQRADLDGSNAEVVVASSARRVTGIAIDGVKGKIYWGHSNTIQRADLDGSNVETFISGGQHFNDPFNDPGHPVDIAVDVVGRKLHWTANELEKGFDSLEDLGFSSYLGFSVIKQADLDDGSNITGALAIGPVVGIALYVPQPVPTLVLTPGTTPVIPTTSGLDPNFPNPFNASTQIAYRLATPGLVRLEIYNVLGQPVRTLVNQFQPAGFYQVRWDARDQRGAAVAAGVYLTRLRHPNGAQTRRLLYLK